MGYNLSPVPNSAEPGAIGFYVCEKMPNGYFNVISDQDAVDGVLRWNDKHVAISAAASYRARGWPVSAIVEVVEGGNSAMDIEPLLIEREERERFYRMEQERYRVENHDGKKSYADFGSW